LSNEIKVADVDQVKELFTALKDKMNSLKIVEKIIVKPFSECSLRDIAKITNGYYNGNLQLDDITKVWNIGDSFTFTLPSVPTGGYVSETQPQQSVTMEIIDFNHDILVDQTKKEKALITFCSSMCLSEKGKMKQARSNNGGWNGSERRNWCNNSLYGVIPQDIKNMIKQVVKKATDGGYSSGKKTILNSNDYCFLLSCVELGGASVVNEGYGLTGDDGFQYAAFTDKNNRTKPGGTYWTRSTRYKDNLRFFEYITNNEAYDDEDANLSYGIRFCFCI